MDAKLIFKMELYKFINDRKYLIIAGVLALLNTIFTIQTMNSVRSFSYYSSAYPNGMMMMMSISLSIIFLSIYPFHALAQDYKNNVLALMMASGVNRTKLYFSKVGATVLCSFGLLLVVVLLPMILISITFGGTDAIIKIITTFAFPFGNLAYHDFILILSLLVSYVLMIVTINTAIVFTKGSITAILLYIGLWLIQTTFLGFFTAPGIPFDSLNTSYLFTGVISRVLVIFLYGYISIRQMKIQSL